MAGYVVSPGVRLESLDDAHVVFCAPSGETHLITDSAAAVLEVLDVVEPMQEEQVAQAIARSWAVDLDEARRVATLAWDPLLAAGLVRRVPLPHRAVRP